MSATERPRRLRVRATILAITAAIGGLAGVALATTLRPSIDTKVSTLLKARLPRTALSRIDCTKLDGLCEVTAGANLFYVDRGARYLVIGRVYDMQTRQDLTAARLLEINPDLLVGGAAKANAAAQSGNGDEELMVRRVATGTGAAMPAARPATLSLDGLSNDGAIVWGNPGGRTVTVFTDFRCGYCRALSNVLRDMNVRVVERPISVLGSRDLADQVYCARNREQALHAVYDGEPVKRAVRCDTGGLDANERFARAHGLGATPVIVRSDGEVLEGYRPKEVLQAWIKGARS